MKDWFEIFAAGSWIDSQGRQKTYSREDLDKIVASYDPGNHEAPIVIGHPANNHPAWGWIAGLKRVGDKLLALPRGVVDEFAEMVKKGLFKKRSISLNPDLSLRHVGFLGAVPPAVKGLEDIRFEVDPAALEYYAEMAEDTWKMGLVGRVLQRLRDFIIDKFDVETANQVVSPFDIDELKRELEPAVEIGDVMNKEFQERLAALEHENRQLREQAAARETEANTYKQQLGDRERQSRREKISLFCEGLVKAGRITEGQKENIVLVLESLHDVAPLQYADKKEKPAVEALQEFLQALPEQIVFREVADGRPAAQQDADDAVRQASDYSAPVNDARLKLRNEAYVLAQKENIGFGAAVRRVLAQ